MLKSPSGAAEEGRSLRAVDGKGRALPGHIPAHCSGLLLDSAGRETGRADRSTRPAIQHLREAKEGAVDVHRLRQRALNGPLSASWLCRQHTPGCNIAETNQVRVNQGGSRIKWGRRSPSAKGTGLRRSDDGVNTRQSRSRHSDLTAPYSVQRQEPRPSSHPGRGFAFHYLSAHHEPPHI